MLSRLNRIRNRLLLKNVYAHEYVNAMRSLRKSDSANRDVYSTEIDIHRLCMADGNAGRRVRKIRSRLERASERCALYGRYAEAAVLLLCKDEDGQALFVSIEHELYAYDAFFLHLARLRDQCDVQKAVYTVVEYGVQVTLGTRVEMDMFALGRTLHGDTFNIRLANYVTALTRMRRRVGRVMGVDGHHERKRAVVRAALRLAERACAFLDANYAEHGDIAVVRDDMARLYRLYGMPLLAQASASDHRVMCWTELNRHVERDMACHDSVRRAVAARTRDIVDGKETLPFLPVFYDIAYDYVQFPDYHCPIDWFTDEL